MRRVKRRSTIVLAMAATVALIPVLSASAATINSTPLAPSDPSSNQRFGFSVAVSADGQTTVVGSISRTVSGVIVPSVAYAYVGATGSDIVTQTEDAQLVRTDTVGMSNSDSFGESVDVSGDGDTIAIGAPGYAATSGAVYIFDRTGPTSWAQTARIGAPPTSLAQFGHAVALSDDGTKLLAGAPALSYSAQGTAAYYALDQTGSWQIKATVAGGSTSLDLSWGGDARS